MYKVGISKVDTTFFKEGYSMLGYGREFHKMEGVEAPQFARAFAIASGTKKVVIVNVEFCFCTNFLKNGVITRLELEYPELGYHDANVMILGQHTHSSAGGYTQYLMYNLSMPGFRDDVYETYRDGIVKAIVEADSRLQDATLKYDTGEFDKDAEICYNRSLRAYNRNPEVEEKVTKKNRHLAADRVMKMIRFDDMEGNPIGSMNWFGVHTTSVSTVMRKVSTDNKGYAATFMEKELKERDEKPSSIHAFSQDATGDISPNFIWSITRRQYRGKHKDDYESAAYNGRLQKDKAVEIFDKIPESGQTVQGEIDYSLMYANMVNQPIPSEFTGGLQKETTGYAALGVAFLEGTTDGIGVHKSIGQAYRLLYNSARQMEMLSARVSKNPKRQFAVTRYFSAHHPKAIVMNLSKGIVAGAKHPERLVLPSFVDPFVRHLKFVNRVGRAARKPWVPEFLPLQIITIGQLAIVGIPSEITTIAGARLRNTVKETLQQRGIEQVILAPYANDYAGYITTYEEYRAQCYEGGHTLFGKWTLAAYQMYFRSLANEMLKPMKERQTLGDEQVLFDRHEIWGGMDETEIKELLLEASSEDQEEP